MSFEKLVSGNKGIVRYAGKGLIIEYQPETGSVTEVKNVWGRRIPAHAKTEPDLLHQLGGCLFTDDDGRKPTAGICGDASTDAPVGRCEIRVTDVRGTVLLDEYIGRHTNNYGELTALLRSIEFAIERGERFVWTDSQVVLAWLKSGPKKDIHSFDEVMKVLRKIWDTLPASIEVKKWHTRAWGEIPADFGRKSGSKERGAGSREQGIGSREQGAVSSEREETSREQIVKRYEYKLVMFVYQQESDLEKSLADGIPKEVRVRTHKQSEEALNKIATEGWRLVSVVRTSDGNGLHYFERPVFGE
ncbi:MAG: DUF4177 domain-containing protein [Planctomycetes bacterium]|nr:DUF4177 domain-containing protein [Planctomycetota bacterium]